MAHLFRVILPVTDLESAAAFYGEPRSSTDAETGSRIER